MSQNAVRNRRHPSTGNYAAQKFACPCGRNLTKKEKTEHLRKCSIWQDTQGIPQTTKGSSTFN